MHLIAAIALSYVALTIVFAILQAIENLKAKPGDTYWAPVWWIALTWPYWIVVGPFRRDTWR